MTGLLTCVWKRPRLTELVLRYYASLDVPLKCVAVYSPEDDTDWIQALDPPWTSSKNDWWFIPAPNEPLGAKWNAGLQALKGCDHVMVIGSDDLVSKGYFERIKGDYVTVRDLYIYDAPKRRLVYAHSMLPGAGRVFCKRVLDILDWTLWDDVNEELDGCIGRRLSTIETRNHHIRDMKSVPVVDVKTEENMWQLEGSRLMRGEREMKIRQVDEIEPRPFFEQHFPEQAEELLNW